MAYVDIQRGYIRFKIIYCGPEESGATSNIEYLQTLTRGKVEVLSLETHGEKNTYYEYMPLQLGKVRGLETTFNLYTAPGKGCDMTTMQLLLEDIDGVVFVADSREAALEANVERLGQLKSHLEKAGASLHTLPVVLQYNKRDLPDIVPVAALEKALNQEKWPHIEASAKTGRNVKETLTLCSQLIYRKAVRQYGLIPSEHPPDPAAEVPREDEDERDTMQFVAENMPVPSPIPMDARVASDDSPAPSALSLGMAEQLSLSVPPQRSSEGPLRASRRAKGSEPVTLNLICDLLVDLEDQIFARCDKTDAMLYRVAQKQVEEERGYEKLLASADTVQRLRHDVHEIREMLGDLKIDMESLQSAFGSLTEAIAKAIRANLESKFAEYIEDVSKDKKQGA